MELSFRAANHYYFQRLTETCFKQMAGQKDTVGNIFLVYKVDVALYNFFLKLTISFLLGTKFSVFPSRIPGSKEMRQWQDVPRS